LINNSVHSGNIRDFAWGNGTYVAVGDYGPTGYKKGTIAFSTDANNWTTVTDSTFGTTTISALAFGNGKFLAGGSIDGKMAYSTDGVIWTAVADSSFR